MNPRLRTAAIAAAVIVLDRITKTYIRSAFTPWDVTPIIAGFFNIVHTENPGRGLRDSRGFAVQMEQHASGDDFPGRDGHHRRDAVAPAAEHNAGSGLGLGGSGTACSVARSAMSGIGYSGAR